MPGLSAGLVPQNTARRVVGFCLCAGVMAVWLVGGARADDAASLSVAPEPPPPAAETARPEPVDPGLLEGFGRWLEGSAAGLNSSLKSTRDVLGNLAGDAAQGAGDAAKAAADAAGAVALLPVTRVAVGRERCDLAPNGAPDCRNAAQTICRGGGYAAGTSLETQSARKCPAHVWLSGRPPSEGECRVETFVTRAACN